MLTVITSGNDAIDSNDPENWTDVLEVPGTSVINWITLENSGDWPGWWRIVGADWETPQARMAAGPGEPGDRRAVLNIPCPGLSGAKLQVKRTLLGGAVTGVYAFGMK